MAAKKAAKKRVVKSAKPVARKATPINKAFNKSEILNDICDSTELARKQVSGVLDHVSHLMERHLKKGGAGIFILPGLLKCQVIHKPATKARKGVNPFTGEEMMFKAKPARNVVKVRALKRLKEMVV